MNALTPGLVAQSNVPAEKIVRMFPEDKPEIVAKILETFGWEYNLITGRYEYKDSFINIPFMIHISKDSDSFVIRFINLFRQELRRCGIPLDEDAKQIMCCFIARGFRQC